MWILPSAAPWLASTTATRAQEIRKLYDTRPPEGSAFVRITSNADLKADNKLLINGSALQLADKEAASRYRAVRADKGVKITIDGKDAGDAIKLLPDRFYTILISRNRESWSGLAIDEGAGSANDLKVQLRFFNMVDGCEASLKVADGPVVFEATKSRSFNSRSINPVQAELQAACNGRSASYKLPQLRTGDHYSLFFRDVAGTAELNGQFDETEPYRAP